jgi:type II secretory pathway pseudopilin PulG
MSGSDWIVLVIGLIAALASITGAVLAANSARDARTAEQETARLQLLEQRLAQRKNEVYQEQIDLLGQMLAPVGQRADLDEAETMQKFQKFSAWIGIVGSDEAVRAWANLMQSTFHEAPPVVLLRLYAEFQLAARRDLGDPDTALTPIELMAVRIKDLYDDPTYHAAMAAPFADVCASVDWPIPWEQDPSADDGRDASDTLSAVDPD